MSWHTQRRVEFQHCDPAGIVFYPRYFEMINSVIEEFFRDVADYPYGKMHNIDHRGVPTARISVEFQAPGFLDEMLDFQLTVTRLGKSSVRFRIISTCDGDARLTAESTMVQVDMHTRKSTPWPDFARENITEIMEN